MQNQRHHHPVHPHVKQRGFADVPVKPAVTTAMATPDTLSISPASAQPITAHAAPTQWLRGKNLDFCLLAMCSCVLALLCHQTVHLPTAQAASTSNLAASSRVWPSQLDFVLKAGLFTSSNQRSEGDEETEQ